MILRNWMWPIGILSLPLVAWFGVWAWAVLSTYRGNAAFPQEMFGGIVAYDRVLSSKKWFRVYPTDLFRLLGPGRFECTWVVVRLAEDAPRVPPSQPEQARSRVFPAGPDSPWRPGPAPSLIASYEGTFRSCTSWGGLGRQRDILLQAVHDPGGWWRDDHDGIFLYSADVRVAAWMTFSD